MSKRALSVCIVVCVAALFFACGGGNETIPPDGGGGGGDAGVDDAGMTDVGGGQECKSSLDCPKGDCVGLTCRSAPRCHCDPQTDPRCLCGATSAGDTQCVPYQVCLEGRMVNVCKTDEDCTADYWCHSGVCEKYDFAITTPEPNAGGTKGALKAGYGEAIVDFPVGVSMAGFGARKGPKTPYNKELGGSTGFYDRPVAKAIVLDNGVERVALLRITSCWSTDYMLSMIAKKLSDKLGENYLNKIITSAGHSHSYPARFWTTAYGMGLGVFGYDEFMWEIFDRLTTSYAAAVEAAVNDLAPAKVGWATDDNFDPDNKITGSRADETFGPGNKDKKFLALRVDSVGGANDGKTKAVLMIYGSHGTHLKDTLITGDAPAAAEQMSEELFEADLGYHVPVIHFNGDAGNSSPSGGDELRSATIPSADERGNGLLGIQAVGSTLYTYLKAKYDGITTFVSDPDMKIATKWIPISRKHLGYTDSEFYLDKGGVKKPYWNGAFQCAAKYKDGGWPDGALGCLIVMDDLNLGAVVPEFSKSRLSVLRLGDLMLATLPGEPTTPAGVKLVASIKAATGLKDVFSVGYSMNHHLYILTPEFWFKGSYEASMDVWGFKEGDYFISESTAIATALKDLSSVTEPVSTVHPSWYKGVLEEKTVTPTAAASGTPGTFYTQPPASVAKGAVLVVEWHGGHPGTGSPRVFLEAKDGNGQWATVKTVGGRDYDDTHFRMIIEYLGNYQDRHDWRATWQEQVRLPAGTYRFRADGAHWDGAKAVAHSALSSEFALANLDSLEIRDLAKSGGNVTFKVNYPPPPQTLTFRLNSLNAPITLGAPLDLAPTVQLGVTCGADTYAKPDAAVTLSADKEQRQDAAGTTWNVRYTTVAFPDVATAACEYDITVTDPWGNTGHVKKTIP